MGATEPRRLRKKSYRSPGPLGIGAPLVPNSNGPAPNASRQAYTSFLRSRRHQTRRVAAPRRTGPLLDFASQKGGLPDNARVISTPRGGQWYAKSESSVLREHGP